MRTVTICFDIDGTLRCNCTETCRDINTNIYCLLVILAKFKNTKIIVWSGGGKEYAESFWNSEQSQKYLEGFGKIKVSFASKLEPIKPDIAIDDQQEFNLGTFNLIVREK